MLIKLYYNTDFLSIPAIVQMGDAVKINKLQVPAVIKHGAPVVLDCDFTLEDTDQDLVVKWFFNRTNQTLVYQWIPGWLLCNQFVSSGFSFVHVTISFKITNNRQMCQYRVYTIVLHKSAAKEKQTILCLDHQTIICLFFQVFSYFQH